MSLLVWHFTTGTLRDGSPLPALGVKLTMAGKIVPCEHGYHGSERIIDALEYAPGPVIHRAELSGEIVGHDGDKHVASERTYLWSLDQPTGERILREFARKCALDVAYLWQMPDVVRQYLETGKEKIRCRASKAATAAASAAKTVAWGAWDANAAARAAVRYDWDTANAAASAAASAAALDASAAARAASAAARAAARYDWDTANAAASAAASAAAWDASAAARVAARASASAAWSPAWSAARDAAREAQNDHLTTLVEAARIA
jgi:hypothetical protein